VNNVSQFPEDPTRRYDEAITELTEARIRLLRSVNAIWFIVLLTLILCAPAAVIAAWTWAL